jgi:hypothetical protein
MITAPLCQLYGGKVKTSLREYTLVARLLPSGDHGPPQVIGLGLHSHTNVEENVVDYDVVEALFQTKVTPCANRSSVLLHIEALSLKFKLSLRPPQSNNQKPWVLLYPFLEAGKLGVVHKIEIEKGSLPFTFNVVVHATHQNNAESPTTALVARRVAPPWFVRQAIAAMQQA